MSHEDFSVNWAQPVTPVKHAFLHFFTLSAIDEFLRIKIFAFLQVDYVKKKEKDWWLGRELNPWHGDFQSPALPTELPSHVATSKKASLFTITKIEGMSKCNLNISYKYVQTVVKLHNLKIEMQTKLEEAIKTPANPRNSIGATIVLIR